MSCQITHDFILTHPTDRVKNTLSVAEYILNIIKDYGNARAMVHSLSHESRTFSTVLQESIKVAEGLKLKGVKPDDVVAICSENIMEYGPVILGILAAGATCCPLNPLYNIDELLHTLSISRPKVIFCSPFTVAKITECRSKMRFIEDIVTFNKNDSVSGTSSYSDLIRNSGSWESFRFPPLNSEESVAFLLCSSGTTGLPKCVELTHNNFVYLMEFIRTVWGEGSDQVTLGLIPFFHGYGCCILLAALIYRVLLVVMMRFEEENFLSSIEKYKVTHLFLVPPLVLFLSKHPLVSKYDLSSVQKIACGAAPLSKETQTAAQKRLNLPFEIRQGYGMTELSLVTVAFQSDVKKTGASGTIAPGMECKIVDVDTGRALPPYQRGELCFRGPFVMKGYRNNKKATEEAFDSAGWFHTGDIGYYDSDGYLYIVDRMKELIKYKGFQVPPAELETILINHPSIKEAGVVGMPDEEAGELPLAFVVLQPGAKLTEKDVQNYVAGKVSPQKRLHGGVRFINEVPKNPSGKILRRELRKLLNKSKL